MLALKGTPVTPPSHYFNLEGTITPTTEIYTPDESRGVLAAAHREMVSRKHSTFQGSGPLDVNILPALLNMYVKNVIANTTPTSGVLTKLWTFVPTMTSDDLRAITAYWGDPNETIFQTTYTMGDTLTITADTTSTDATMVEMSGWGQFPESLGSAPALPLAMNGGLINGLNMQVWMDTTSAIGTTEILSPVLRATHTIPTGVIPKYFADGPAASLGFTRHGRAKRRITTDIEMEFNNLTTYNQFANGTPVKLRVRHNGDFIETVAGPIDYYNYVEVDTYGLLRDLEWGDMDGANRTVKFSVQSVYDATLGADFAIRVQNERNSL